MAFTPGGRADKFGNQYESLWVASRLIDVISEHKRSIILEPIGEMEHGVDLWVENFDGIFSAEQCKARNGSKDRWSVFDLKKVLVAFYDHMKRDHSIEFRLISPLPFTLLSDLCEESRNSDSSEGFFSSIVCSDDKENVIFQIAKTLSLDAKSSEDQFKIYSYLKKFKIEQFFCYDDAVEHLKHKISIYLTGNPDVNLSLLRTYVLDANMLGRKIFYNDIMSFLELNSIYPRKILNDERIGEKLKNLNDNFCSSISNLLINRELIRRDETKKCLHALDKSSVVIVHGEAGKGKSGVLYEIMDELKKSNINHLALRLDRKIPKGSTSLFGKQIGLPDSPTLCLAKFSGTEKCVLILDQLDAIRWTSTGSMESLDICKQLVHEALTYNAFENGNLKIILSCRSFDLNNDPEINNWLVGHRYADQFFKIEVGDLDDSVVRGVIGENFKILSSSQLKILAIPQNLYMWKSLNVDSSVNFSSPVELLKAFWLEKKLSIEDLGFSSATITSLINKLVSYMDQTGTVSAPERVVLSESSKCLEALYSSSVITKHEGRVMFSHQSYLDFFIALKVFDEVSSGKSILGWLGSKSDQTLYKRQSLIFYLQMLLMESPADFVTAVREILYSNETRFHIKHLALEVLGQSLVITREFSQLIDELLLDSFWLDQFLHTTIVGKPVLARCIFEKGTVLSWLKINNSKLVDNSLALLRSVIEGIPEEVCKVLRDAYDMNLLSAKQAFSCLSFNIIHDTDDLFEFRLKLIRNGADLNFVDWKVLASEKPKYALKLLRELCDQQTKIRSNKSGNVGCRLYGDDVVELLRVSKMDPYYSWDLFLKFAIDKLNIHNNKGLKSSFSSFDIEKNYSKRNLELEEFQDISILLVVEAGKTISKIDPDFIIDYVFKNGIDESSILPDNALSKILLELPLTFSDFVIEWLLADLNRLSMGLGFRRPKWLLAADLISRFSVGCNELNFVNIESVLYRYVDHDKKERSYIEYRLKMNSKKGYEFPLFGEAQYFLLPSLAKNRISSNTKLLIMELERKFSRYPMARFCHGLDSKGGYLGSSLEPNLENISVRSWKSIIINNSTPKRHGKWIQYNSDTIHASSHDLFASSLERIAKKDPRKFCEMLLELPVDIEDCYISSILRAFSSDEKARHFDTEDVSRSEDLSLLEIFWKKFRVRRFELNVARSYCWLIQSRARENWPFWMIEDLVELSLNHDDPYLDTESNKEDSSSHSLFSKAINSVRGSAVIALGSLLWSHKEIFFKIENEINSVLNDKHPSVVACLVHISLPLLNIDSDKAIDLFVKACSVDLRIASLDHSINFFNYSISFKDPRISEIIIKMLNSDNSELIEKAAEMVTFYSQCHEGVFSSELSNLINGSKFHKQGALRAAKNLIRNNYQSISAKEIIKACFNDPDEDIRKSSSRLFSNEKILDSSSNLELAMAFVNSLAFSGEEFIFFRCLVNFKGDLLLFKDLLLIACMKTIDNFKKDKIEYSMRFEINTLVSLLIRLYEYASTDHDLRDRCLDLWDKFFELNIGGTRDLTELISK